MSELHRHCQCDQCSGEDCEGLNDIHSTTPTSPPAPRPPCEECMYQERIDKAAKAREQVLDEMGLNCWGEYQMNNRRCMICQVGERCYDKRQSLRAQQGGVSE